MLNQASASLSDSPRSWSATACAASRLESAIVAASRARDCCWRASDPPTSATTRNKATPTSDALRRRFVRRVRHVPGEHVNGGRQAMDRLLEGAGVGQGRQVLLQRLLQAQQLLVAFLQAQTGQGSQGEGWHREAPSLRT